MASARAGTKLKRITNEAESALALRSPRTNFLRQKGAALRQLPNLPLTYSTDSYKMKTTRLPACIYTADPKKPDSDCGVFGARAQRDPRGAVTDVMP